jgi:hypothetical protein
MPSKFDQHWATAAGKVMDVFADETPADTYTPFGGVARTVRGFIETEPARREGQQVESRAAIQYTALINGTDGLPAEPNYGGDTITLGVTGKTYRVHRSPLHDAGDRAMITVELR